MIELTKKTGRIEISLTAFEMGRDLCVILTGGKAHLGSVTLGYGGNKTETYPNGKHKEFIVTKMIGEILEKHVSGGFVICCGIHIDNITKEEIDMVEYMCKELAEDLSIEIRRHSKKQNV